MISTKGRFQATAIRYADYMCARKEYVTTLAHLHWLERGCPEGSPEVDWFSAELQADQELIEKLDLGLPA